MLIVINFRYTHPDISYIRLYPVRPRIYPLFLKMVKYSEILKLVSFRIGFSEPRVFGYPRIYPYPWACL